MESTLMKKIGYNVNVKTLADGSWTMNKSYNDIDGFISDNAKFNDNLYMLKKIDKDVIENLHISNDKKLILRAIYLQDIPPMKSKFCHTHWCEFIFQRMLLKLQNEVKNYDVHNSVSVQMWCDIRMSNLITRFNQLRTRWFYYKDINF